MFLTMIFQDLKPSNIAVNEDCELKVIYGHFPCFWDRERGGWGQIKWYYLRCLYSHLYKKMQNYHVSVASQITSMIYFKAVDIFSDDSCFLHFVDSTYCSILLTPWGRQGLGLRKQTIWVSNQA